MLARWSGWGAIPQVFDESNDRYAEQRETLRRLLGSDQAWAQARRTTLNAHYTSAEVAAVMWSALGDLGLTKGRVLEPGCGAGVFLGFAPEGAEVVGVELDATTARVADHLYGARAEVHVGGFEEFAEPDGSFDAVIGNVPFGKIAPYDPRHNRSGHTLHNYFLVKSLRLTRPGGLVIVLTSRYTLDARNPAARKEMARLADLVGAVRLPERTFAGAAGTDVVTDLLVLRRRQPGSISEGPAWTGTVPLDLADVAPEAQNSVAAISEPLVINEYLAGRGDMVLGDLAVARGMYREHELTVTATGPVEARLVAALDQLAAEAKERGATLTGRSVAQSRSAGSLGAGPEAFDTHHAQEGSLVVGAGGLVGQYKGGRIVAYRPQRNKDFSELRRLIGLRDSVRQVLAVQLAGGTDDEVTAAQRRLSDTYADYKRIYGPLNRYRIIRTKRADPETGEPVLQRRFPSMGGFRKADPDWPLVAALEVFDDESQTAEPAPVFSERVVAPPAARARVESASDAVAVCLDESGMVTTERVAELLGVTEQQARAEMGELVFEDPETAGLVPASQYLAGNVRRKLEAARTAVAGGDQRWQANITALERAMPRQLEPGEIAARLGAAWIPAADVEAFCNEVFQASVDIEHLADIGRWAVKLRFGDRRSVVLSSVWGTERASAVNLLDSALNQRLHTVYDTIEDGGKKRRVRNDEATLAARDRQEAIGNRFSEWVWDDPARARRLAGTYNELYRSVTLTEHDGSHLSLPGLAATFTPRPHQRDAVARILTDGRALLAHAVGAGKTATMVMAAMELRRLGSASKPAVAVPNHMLEQFSREWLQLYPTARILIADSGQLDKARRKEFVARCALGDWDGIVFTHSGFESIPLGRELQAEYLGAELGNARMALAASKKRRGFTVKRLEKLVAQAEERYKKLLSVETKDDGVRFEETGIDHVTVDEAHLFKNRRIITEIDGVAHPGSKRAQDLDAKLWALRKLHGPRTVTFSTATPVANSMAELWVMQSYLQPDVLDEAMVRAFDAWAANFGRTHTALELAPDGASYRMKTRFARFQNIPELLGLYHQVADVRTAEDLALPTPSIRDGKPETVVVPCSDALFDFVQELVERAEAIRNGRVQPEEDNMLAVTGAGRRAALDLRLVDLPPDPDGGKITAAARRIADVYHATRGNQYRDGHGQLSSRAGALQLVFCDVSTPAGEGWNAYDELRHQLDRRGVPADAIRYMQDAKTHQAKGELFAACRDGQVAVLIGSTETMGVGTNVQTRAVALHHLDAPWRPADIEQREGRIIRQGNQNGAVEVIRYVTEGSFDTYMWQTLERKAAFIHQVAGRDFDEREAEDIGEQVLSFAEVKALATGDARIMEKATVDTDVARLVRLKRLWHEDQRRLRYVLDKARQQAETATAAADRFAAVFERVTDTRGDKFEMVIGGRREVKRATAGERLHEVLTARLQATPPETTTEPEPVAYLAGLDVLGQTTTAIESEVRLLVPEAEIEMRFVQHEWASLDATQLVQRLERRIQRLPETIERFRNDATAATQEAERAEERLGESWEHADELSRLQRRQHELNEALNADSPADDSPVDLVDHALHDGLSIAGFDSSNDAVSRLRERLDHPRSPSPDAGLSL